MDGGNWDQSTAREGLYLEELSEVVVVKVTVSFRTKVLLH